MRSPFVSMALQVQVLGYGRMEVQPKLQLVIGAAAKGDAAPLAQHAMPLALPFTSLLSRPATAPNASDFYTLWATLPVRVELAGACVWPGLEGAQMLMSCMLRTPMACASLALDPPVAGFQAAFMAETCLGDTLAVMVSTQLLPGSAAGSAESFCHLSFR